jgi:RNA polymerase sigma-70 factor (ECF subfamily)
MSVTSRAGGAVDEQDRASIRAVAAGETSALAALADRYEADLLGLARGLLRGRRQLAEDAVQDVWMRVIRSAGTYADRATVRTWLYRITVNRCRDLGRTEARRRGRTLDAGTGRDGPDAAAADAEADRDELAALQAAVDRLDRRRREVVLLCYHADLTHEQVAVVLEIPLGTVKSRLHAALTALRDSMKKEGDR